MGRTRTRVVALLTDFGMRDWYVATLKGVILSRCPQARLIDITHEIPPQDVMAGAFTLAAAAPWFPRGTVFIAVVDPGVGSPRALLAAQADGRYFIGPDNGLLALALDRAARRTMVRLTQARYWLPEVSRTFQGRDILAPVAAHLARGGSLSPLGTQLDTCMPLSLPPVQRRGRSTQGCIVHIDVFGNLITNLSATLVPSGRGHTRPVVRYKGRTARWVSSYAEGRAQELITLIGSLGFLELAIREGSAAWSLNAARADPVELTG